MRLIANYSRHDIEKSTNGKFCDCEFGECLLFGELGKGLEKWNL